MNITPKYIQDNFMNGMPLVDVQGRPVTAARITEQMKVIKSEFRMNFGLLLDETIVKMGHLPLEGERIDPTVKTALADGRDFDPRDFEGNRFMSTNVPYFPIREIHSVGVVIPLSRKILRFPQSWIIPQPDRRSFQVYPLSAGGGGLSFSLVGFNLALLGKKIIPSGVHVSYTAGLTDNQLDEDMAWIKAAFCKAVVLATLVPGSINTQYARGVNSLSVSVDGLSNTTSFMHSAQALMYQSLINTYQQDVRDFFVRYKRLSGNFYGFL